MNDREQTSVWRPSTLVRVGVYALGVFFIVLGARILVVAAGEDEAFEGGLFVTLAFGAPTAITVAWAHRCRIVCSQNGVEVVGLLSRRRIGWHRIVRASPGYWGTELLLSDGATVVGSAVQKANVSVWLKRHTRADELADLINSRAGRT